MVGGVATPANFSLTNSPGAPASITPGPGTTPQSVPVTNLFATLSGTVSDKYNNVVPGAVVNLAAPASGASGTFADTGTNTTNATTNGSGVFTASAFTANTNPGGPYAVTASAQTGTATFSYQLTNTDFSLNQPPPTSTIFIQGQSTPLSPNVSPVVTVSPLSGYTGTVSLSCVAAGLPSGVTCPSFNPATATFANGVPTSVPSTVTVNTSTTTPEGIYAIPVQGIDGSPRIVVNQANFGLSVECQLSVGNLNIAGTLPTLTPAITATGEINANFFFYVTEINGGTACTYGKQVFGGTQPGPVTGTSGIVPIPAGETTGTLPGVNMSNQVIYNVTAISSTATAPQFDSITTYNFQAGQPGNVMPYPFYVTQEVPAAPSFVAGTSGPVPGITISVGGVSGNPNNMGGNQLSFANLPGLNASTVCSAARQQSDGSFLLDSTSNNFGITCSASSVSLTGSADQVGVTLNVSQTTQTSSLPLKRGSGIQIAFALALPGLGFLSLGARNCGRRKLGALSALLLVLLLSFLPACGGGINGTIIQPGKGTGTYALTIMGTVTNGSGSVVGVEIFNITLTVTPTS